MLRALGVEGQIMGGCWSCLRPASLCYMLLHWHAPEGRMPMQHARNQAQVIIKAGVHACAPCLSPHRTSLGRRPGRCAQRWPWTRWEACAPGTCPCSTSSSQTCPKPMAARGGRVGPNAGAGGVAKATGRTGRGCGCTDGNGRRTLRRPALWGSNPPTSGWLATAACAGTPAGWRPWGRALRRRRRACERVALLVDDASAGSVSIRASPCSDKHPHDEVRASAAQHAPQAHLGW